MKFAPIFSDFLEERCIYSKFREIPTNFHQNKYGARPARAFPLVANKQHQAVISEISEIGWLRRLAVTARLAVLAG